MPSTYSLIPTWGFVDAIDEIDLAVADLTITAIAWEAVVTGGDPAPGYLDVNNNETSITPPEDITSIVAVDTNTLLIAPGSVNKFRITATGGIGALVVSAPTSGSEGEYTTVDGGDANDGYADAVVTNTLGGPSAVPATITFTVTDSESNTASISINVIDIFT